MARRLIRQEVDFNLVVDGIFNEIYHVSVKGNGNALFFLLVFNCQFKCFGRILYNFFDPSLLQPGLNPGMVDFGNDAGMIRVYYAFAGIVDQAEQALADFVQDIRPGSAFTGAFTSAFVDGAVIPKATLAAKRRNDDIVLNEFTQPLELEQALRGGSDLRRGRARHKTESAKGVKAVIHQDQNDRGRYQV